MKPLTVFVEALCEWLSDPRGWVRFLRQVCLLMLVVGIPYTCSGIYRDNAMQYAQQALDVALEDCALNRGVAASGHTLPQYKVCVKEAVRRYEGLPSYFRH